ncbi:MAG: HXXEE domain-containing protein [Gemmatimonadales bacterium]
MTTPGIAWLGLTVALALHVLDESLHGFLSYYNPAALAIRDWLPLVAPPTFSFEVWLVGLIVGVIVLLASSPLAFRRVRWLRPVALGLSVIMIFNAGIHITWSLALGEVVPGTYTAPVLLAAALCLLVAAVREWKPSVLH